MPRTFEDDLASDVQNAFLAEFAKLITYSRKALTNSTIRATPVRPVGILLSDGEVIGAHTNDLDWLLAAADLELDSEVVTPRDGDRITATIGGISCTYEALTNGNSPCWEYDDALGLMLRIHTKKVAG